MAEPIAQDGKRGRVLRGVLIAVAVLVVVVVGGVAIVLASFDPNSLKPRIAEAVKQATGRELSLNGDIGLKWALMPTIAVHDVALANPPGFSRPQMATLGELDLQLALIPLLSRRIEIERLVLIHPDIRLERDPQGEPNWHFASIAQPKPEAVVVKSAGGGVNAPGLQIGVRDLRIEDGSLSYRDRTGKTIVLDMHTLTATASAPDAPLHLTTEAAYNGTPFTLTAETGSLNRLEDDAAATPWPVKLALKAAAAQVTADGTLTHPLDGRGYDVAVSGSAPDLAALAPLLPNLHLPPLHDVTFAGHVADSGTPMPVFSSLTVHAGRSDLGTMFPGLVVEKLDVSAPTLDQPVKGDLTGTLNGAPVTATASLPPPARLMNGAVDGSTGAVPIDVTADIAGAHLTAKGTTTDPNSGQGVSVDLTASIPDLSALSPLAQRPLPAVKSLAFQAHLTDPAGGFSKGLALTGIVLTSADGDLKGDASAGFGLPFSVTAKLTSDRIDADALASAEGKPLPNAAGKPTSSPPPPHKREGRLFSDQPIPFGLLQLANADVALTLGDLRIGGRDTRNIQAHVVLQDGKLTADPLVADLPTGHMDGKLTADATQKAPPVAIVFHAPGLALRTLLAMAGEPDEAGGDLEVYADLHGAGETPHAIAASVDGTLGLALEKGSIDNRLLGQLLGPVLDKARFPNILERGGFSDIHCAAVRVNFDHGVGRFKTLALSSSLLTMDGGGSVNLGEEALDVHLRPQIRLGGSGVILPLHVSGPIGRPDVRMDPLGTAEANAGSVAGALIGDATPLGLIGGLLGADKLLGERDGGAACSAPLAVARGQAVPAASSPGGLSIDGHKLPNPGALLKQLFR